MAKPATGVETLVFLMGYKNLSRIVERPIQNGRLPRTPAALIRWGTTPEQVTGRASPVPWRIRPTGRGRRAGAAGHPGGGVGGRIEGALVLVRAAPSIWKTDRRYGPREQASDLVPLLENLGANCLEFPTIRLAPPPVGRNWTRPSTPWLLLMDLFYQSEGCGGLF